jgi:hypothetical protein
MKIFTKLVLIIFFFSITAFSQITLPHYDSFNYTVGQGLQTQTGWNSLNSGDDLLITSGNLSYSEFAAPSGNKVSFDGAGIDATKEFTQQTNGTVYYSFLLNIKSLGSLSTTGGYFAGFIQTTTSNFGATVWLKRFGSGFTIGLNPRSTGNTIWSNDTLKINKTYFVVASYEFVSGATNDIVKLWLNPSSASFGLTEPSPTLSATNTGTELNSLDQILVRQDSNTETPFIELDELRIGTTWADVTPPVGISPLITVAPTGLENFTYVVGSGPSDLQNYVITGSNLNGSDVVITAPTNYEISSNGGASWSNTITISGYGTSVNQTISIRLKSGLAIGSYDNEVITNTGGGAATINVVCNGEVNPVPADQFFTDYFSYATGQLTDAPNGTGGNVSGGNWVSFSGIANYIQVSSGGLSYTGYPSSGTGNKINIVSPVGSGEDVYRQFTNQVAGSTIYISFLLNVTNTDGLAANSSTTGDHFVTLMPINSTTIFVSRVSIKLGTVANTFQIGLRATSSNADAVWNPNNLNPGTTYLIVISYQIITGNSNDVAKLWINPSLSGTEPAPDLTQTSALISDVTSIARLAIRQNSSTSPEMISTPNASIDGIRVAPSWSNAPLPVELSSFSASVVGYAVKLNWKTETEVNNYGFEIHRTTSPLPSPYQGEGGVAGRGWEKIGFVNGNGNSNSPKSYSFTDTDVLSGKYSYRLKQIDNDGQFEYSKTIEVDLGAPTKFELSQNYPNPFNPITKIKYAIPNVTLSVSSRAESRYEGSLVVLKVYDVLGNEVTTLVNEEQTAGVYEVEFSSVGLASGIYFYRIAIQSDKLQSGSFVETKKMIIMK